MRYALFETLEAIGPLEALEMAIKNKKIITPYVLIHHPDRGVQYCSSEYVKVLTKENIAISMPQSYIPYQNALAERINGTIKNDFFPKQIFQKQKEAKKGLSFICWGVSLNCGKYI